MAQLHILESLPAGLLDASASDLHRHLPGPTVLLLAGAEVRPLFISVLLHGNETSGWTALVHLLKQMPELPRSLVVLIGNIEAAAVAQRSLPAQPDYNRIWRQPPPDQAGWVQQLLALVDQQQPLAAIDIHNNTGRNPHYSVLTQVTPETLGLAELFSDTAVVVEEPDSVLTRALAPFCPAIAVEAGPIGDSRSDERALGLLLRACALEAVPRAQPASLRLHRAVARVHVRADVRYGFADTQQSGGEDELTLTAGMEAVNFHSLTAGTVFGHARAPLAHVLRVLSPRHQDVTDHYFRQDGAVIALARPVIPAMYTTDQAVIAQDCLCYLMETIDAAP